MNMVKIWPESEAKLPFMSRFHFELEYSCNHGRNGRPCGDIPDRNDNYLAFTRQLI